MLRAAPVESPPSPNPYGLGGNKLIPNSILPNTYGLKGSMGGWIWAKGGGGMFVSLFIWLVAGIDLF
jgi:hypothetical protein